MLIRITYFSEQRFISMRLIAEKNLKTSSFQFAAILADERLLNGYTLYMCSSFSGAKTSNFDAVWFIIFLKSNNLTTLLLATSTICLRFFH